MDNAAKSARSKGIAGHGRKGPIEKKVLLEPYLDTCRFKCTERISEEERQDALDQFYQLDDETKKWQCLINWITYKNQNEMDREALQEAIEIAEIQGKTLKEKKYLNFNLPTSTGLISVCRTMFLNTLGMLYLSTDFFFILFY